MSKRLSFAAASPDDLTDLFESAPCGYVVLSPAGRILRANRTLGRWLGLPVEEIVGRPFRDLLTIPGRIFYETNFAPLLRIQGAFEEVALDMLSADGEKLPMLVNASERRDENNAAVAIRVALFKAQDRRGYERELHDRERRAVERLTSEEETAKLREQFIAVLGHDLRNPLASIAAAARLLRREGQNEKALRVIALMEASVERMAGLIDDVMDFARGRLGRGIVVSRTLLPVGPVVQQVAEELAAAYPERTIISHIDAPQACAIDESRLGQMVSNLLANALTHGDPKAPIELRVRIDASRLSVSVANQGRPIDPTTMDRLFQPFFRGEVAASKQGLGLGLHIASEIAKAHGGDLTCTSTELETCFTFTMPTETSPSLGPA